jgi:hypothetical protein
MKKLVACLFFIGCAVYPPLPPDPSGATCASACANLRQLGGCGNDMSRCDQDCADAEHAEAQLGIRHPVRCLTEATTCEAAKGCE